MAGKTKKSGSRPTTPKSARPKHETCESAQFGHMGIKSSAFAPTDCKLVNQYMALDRMQAHYKKLNKAKAAVDTSTPKSWLVSQKLRDSVKRDDITTRSTRKGSYRPRKYGPNRRGSVASEDDRVEMLAMMESLSHLEGGLDEFDGRAVPRRANTSMEMHYSNSSNGHVDKQGMLFVDQIVNDNTRSPSKYFTGQTYTSNIPASSGRKAPNATRIVAQKPLYKTQVLDSYQTNLPLQRCKSATPRSGDVLEQNAGKFTEEKPFQPRTLKTDRKSKLSDFKYYTPPKRKSEAVTEDLVDGNGNSGAARPDTGMSTQPPSVRASMRSRPGTANTMNSTDWMNETIISRDHSHRDTPQGVPALDISLDQDHLKWIKEQQQSKAQYRLKSPHSDLGSTRAAAEPFESRGSGAHMFGKSTNLNTFTLHDSFKISGEEELRYLQFIQDVTNDVLDRGIFTNRVLRVVFESHVERRKHELKLSKMREMLEDLRVDLGIPANDEEDDPQGMGLTSTWAPPQSTSQTYNPRASRRTRQDLPTFSATSQGNLPNLHHTTSSPAHYNRGRTPSPEGKPPIPRAIPRTTTKTPPNASLDKLNGAEDGSVNMTESLPADILTINHEEDNTQYTTMNDFTLNAGMMNSTMRGAESGPVSDDEQDAAAQYEKQLASTLDDDERASQDGSVVSAKHDNAHSDGEDKNYQSDFDEDMSKGNLDETSKDRLHSASESSLRNDSSLKPTPRERRRKGNEAKDSARSLDKGNTTTDTLGVSDLDEDEYDDSF